MAVRFVNRKTARLYRAAAAGPIIDHDDLGPGEEGLGGLGGGGPIIGG